MIVINVAMQHDNIIELLNSLNQEDMTFSFKEKKGIKLYFETNASDLDRAAKVAKDAIKAQPWGSVLYLQSEATK